MIACGHDVCVLKHSGAAFEHQFWRDFDRSLINDVKRAALLELIVIMACLLC